MILPLCKHGDLFDIVEKNQGLTESQSKLILKQLVSALNYLHDKGICHWDIKLENILVDSPKTIKLIDFGFSEQREQFASI